MLGALASAAAGYLIGTIPCADAAARLATGGTTDLRNSGTGASVTNDLAVDSIFTVGGTDWVLSFSGDLLKK